MSLMTIGWSMCSAAALVLGSMHVLVWWKNPSHRHYVLSALMAFSAAANAMIELSLARASTVEVAARLVWAENVCIFMIAVPMIWFFHVHFGTGRRWLAILFTTLWSIGILSQLVLPGSLSFVEITSLEPHATFWGEPFVVVSGTINALKVLPDSASVVLLVYLLDGTLRARRRESSSRSIVVGGAMLTFLLAAGIHTPLVDAGVVETPFMVSFAFLAILVAMTYDIVTDAVRASRYAIELESWQKRWHSLLDNVQLAVLDVDPVGRIRYVNPFLTDLTGHPSEQLVGRPVSDLVPTRLRGELERRFQRASLTQPQPHAQWPVVTASNDEHVVSWSSVRLSTPSGHFDGLLAIGADINDEIAAQRDLDRTRRDMNRVMRSNLLGEFASGLAHELTQPLAAMLSNAQALRRSMGSGTASDSEIREVLDDIIREDKRAADIIHGLRTMLSQEQPLRSLVDVNTSIGEVVRLLQPEMALQKIRLDLDLSSSGVTVKGDPVGIQQVIFNLVTNAIRAMEGVDPVRRKLRIASITSDGLVRVDVEDTGPGVAPDLSERIFDAFARGDRNGLGMGLTICRRIAELHGGTVQLAQRYGGGARFSFSLPATEGFSA